MNQPSRLERIDDTFPDLWRRFMQRGGPLAEMAEIRVDVDEHDDHYAVRAEIPGAKKEDIAIDIDGNRVSITAETRSEREDKDDKGRAVLRETTRGRVSRSFTLAHEIDEAGAAARLADGVLTLRLPKRRGAGSRRIAIE